VLFVKLWQFDLADRREVTINTAIAPYEPVANRPGVELMPLFRDEHEDVRLERWAPGNSVTLSLPGGAELLDGTFGEGGERFERQSWLRSPAGSTLCAKAGADGCTVWVKTGHLRNIYSLKISTAGKP
jgi:hypothetical protein